jgi:hypothetical protein
MTKAYQQINEDTARAGQGVKPDVLVNVYGNKPPRAAEFGKGVSDRAGAQEAQDARRNARPGEYDRKR